MVYYVTKTPQLFKNSQYEIITVERSLELLNSLDIVEVDTETTGLDMIVCKLLLLQLGCKEFQIVIDCSTINVLLYKEFLESSRLFLFWNAKFDLGFLYKYEITPKNIYDGFLAESLLFLGFPAGMHSASLLNAAKSYLGVYLDKSVRSSITSGEISDEIILYAAKDVTYLGEIREKQLILLAQKELLRALAVENEFVKVLAYIEFCGVKLSEKLWKEKMEIDQNLFSQSLQMLNTYVIKNFSDNPKFCKKDLQGDLFTGFNSEPICIINWNSSSQVSPLLELLGFNIKVFDKKTQTFKKSCDAKILEPQKDINDEFLNVYLTYKGAQKVVSTYGQAFLNTINPIDGRIHTQYYQLQNTGRVSCGNSSYNEALAILKHLPKKEVSYPNLQNLPSDKLTRSAFVAEEGNSWISIDYCGQESFLMASIANDTAMLEELINGSGDLHSLTAKMVFKHIPEDTPVKDIKKLFHQERQDAKGYEFAFNYGGTSDTICKNFGLTKERSKEIYDNYNKGFKGLANYQAFRRKEVMKLGYILLSPITGHKMFVHDYPELLDIQNKFTNDFWDEYRAHKKNEDNHPILSEVSKYYSRKSTLENKSINYPIQGAGALCFKLASIKFFNWIINNNYFNTVKYVIPCHDELNVECPTELAEEVALKLRHFMVEAGKIFCKRALLDAEYNISDHWVH